MLISLFPKTHTRYTSLPLIGGFLQDLCSWLEARGYPPNAISRRIQAAPFLDSCLRQQQIHSLSGCGADRLQACLPRQDRWTPQIAYALGRSLIEYLGERGTLVSPPPTASRRLIDEYCEHLDRVRGLAGATVARHGVLAGNFLRFLEYDNDLQRLPHVQAGDLEAFVVEASSRVGRITMQKVTAVMRSFLRFLDASGEIPVGLDRRLESPRHRRGEQLVRALPWDDVVSLLRCIDRSTIKGSRDYAILLLIATYGLRRSEVSRLTIDDVQWRARVIRVARPKIGTPIVVPLTDEVATALVDYLHQRTAQPIQRRLFLRVRAPWGPIEPTAIYNVFDAWATRAGVHMPEIGGRHTLRHGLAMHLLRQGTSLKTIGDVLGHRSVESTGIYLRLQVEDLRDVGLPLPTPASCLEGGL